MSEKELSEMEMLERAAHALTGRFKEYHINLEKTAAQLALDREDLEKKAEELNAWEAKVSRQAAEVGQIRQIAADRKAQLEVAQDNAAKANELRKKAETDMRLAKEEKTRMEEVLVGLLKEKTELQAQLAAATQANVTV